MTPSIPAPLLAEVRQLIEAARQRVASAVNAEFTQLYGHIGRRISTEPAPWTATAYGLAVTVKSRHCEHSAAIHVLGHKKCIQPFPFGRRQLLIL